MVDKVYLVTPRGFCAGVEMAIKALSWMLKMYDETIYCYHEIVHNKWIVEKFQNNNVVFVEDPDEIPNGAVVMLSAHGTSPSIEGAFNNKSSLTINSVCPLVTKVHHEAKRYTDKGTQVIYVGHKGHDEAIGALGVSPENMHLVEKIDDVEKLNIDGNAALLAQTTLAISEWEPIMMKSKNKFKNLNMPRKSDLCYATTNRQSAILEVLPNVDTVLVVGSENSSNTKALVKMVESKNVQAFRIEDTSDLKEIKINGNIAITAGASAPDHLVFNIISELKPTQIVDFEHKNESEYFPLPKELRNNVKLISSFLEVFNDSEFVPEKKNGISNDRNWSATEALSSL
tara:strand:+ start:3494 stop:4522 length:1029 start_codon:yes stop_codon:yes gene_type:complete